MNNNNDSEKDSEFFVGYLPVPGKLRMLYWLVIPVLLIAVLGFGYGLSSSALSAGEGQWLPGETRTTTGILSLNPYPVLHTTGEDARSILLVRPGKSSAADLAAPLAGKFVSISGVPIDRGGWSMLEVYRATDINEQTAPDNVSMPVSESLGEVILSGEIVDSKCFLGVMKPGSGKIHRACAAMCLTGGMPPMLVVTDTHDDRYGYMLINADGSSASRQLVPFVDVPVRVTGVLERRGDLTYLRVAAQGVELITTAGRTN